MKWTSWLCFSTLLLLSASTTHGESTQPGSLDAAQYQVIAFKGLKSGQRFQATAGSLLLQANLQPTLKPGHRLQLYIDSQYHSTLENSDHFRINGIQRGNQIFQLKVFDAQTRHLIQTGAPVELDIRRNINAGNRRKAPK